MPATMLHPGEHPIDIVPDRTARATYDVYEPHVDFSDPTMRVMPRSRSAVVQITDDRVVIDPEVMEVDRPYLYHVNGDWLAAVRRASGSIDFFVIP